MFKVQAPFAPSGDQPQAIKKLADGLAKGMAKQTLLGVTGSGKTFTMAHVIEQYKKPTLVIAHNKTLAFQLYTELKEFFPKNRVEFFISYYDYYQPESYLPATDTYIEKDAKINKNIEKMRLAATTNLLSREDVIVVASVSCIYGLGNPETYEDLRFLLQRGMKMNRRELLTQLILMQYERNQTELEPGRFRVKGNTIDLIPSYEDHLVRIQLDDEGIAVISILDKQNLTKLATPPEYLLFPAKHFVVKPEVIEDAVEGIKAELQEHLPALEQENKLFAYRLNQRVNHDIEMIEEMGYCSGIENYSRFFDKRKPGERPFCLLDYFPEDFLLIIDESHQTIPQLHAMYKGDRSRKETLVSYGFRLPSALDNRPLMFDEFKKFMKHVVFVSATPGQYEKDHSAQIVEQIIRPTGLVDPIIVLRPAENQIEDLILEIKASLKKNNRVLVTTLTKRLSEELTNYLANREIKVRYLHSEIDSLERTEIIRQLRLGTFDVLIGINLLREGLDIPECGLVAILDADKEGFLRDEKSLIQTIGRAARNSESKVILYAQHMTDSMRRTITETKRRRELQLAYNAKHNITPTTISKPIAKEVTILKDEKSLPKKEIPNLIIQLEAEMRKAADELEFEKAIHLRERVRKLQKLLTQSKSQKK
ncbi:MAG: excinuclease ABC subunit UvrB [Candidatus Woesearchaeota archaeon]|nr:MAG: excinuclease ABC subunit UvrB [Candidatus Woesearchaeota archaeon]